MGPAQTLDPVQSSGPDVPFWREWVFRNFMLNRKRRDPAVVRRESKMGFKGPSLQRREAVALRILGQILSRWRSEALLFILKRETRCGAQDLLERSARCLSLRQKRLKRMNRAAGTQRVSEAARGGWRRDREEGGLVPILQHWTLRSG